MKLLETLQRIKEAVGDDVFKDALAQVYSSTTPPQPPPGMAVREEAGDDQFAYTLPHIFYCEKQHRHLVTKLDDLFSNTTPRCLIKRLLLEWAALTLNSPSDGAARGVVGR